MIGNSKKGSSLIRLMLGSGAQDTNQSTAASMTDACNEIKDKQIRSIPKRAV